MRSHGFDDISHRNYPGFQNNIITGKSGGIAGTIHSFMMLKHGLRDRPGEIDTFQDIISGLRMFFDDAEFSLRNPLGLPEDFRRDTDFPDIVDGAQHPHSFDFIRGKTHLCSDGTSEQEYMLLVSVV